MTIWVQTPLVLFQCEVGKRNQGQTEQPEYASAKLHPAKSNPISGPQIPKQTETDPAKAQIPSEYVKLDFQTGQGKSENITSRVVVETRRRRSGTVDAERDGDKSCGVSSHGRLGKILQYILLEELFYRKRGLSKWLGPWLC